MDVKVKVHVKKEEGRGSVTGTDHSSQERCDIYGMIVYLQHFTMHQYAHKYVPNNAAGAYMYLWRL